LPDNGRLSGLSFERPIPQAVRDYGRALDPAMLDPGDLILVSRKIPNWTSKRITDYQAKMFSMEHARWYHAAVSGGRYEICEATLTGVKAHEYWSYMTGEYDLKVRRLKGADAETRSRLAYFAASSVGTSYGFFNLINIAKSLRTGNDWSRPVIPSKGIICSELYFEASMRVGYLLANIRPEAVCPAQLSLSPILQDVPLSWVKV
jgi:hypothetical protein